MLTPQDQPLLIFYFLEHIFPYQKSPPFNILFYNSRCSFHVYSQVTTVGHHVTVASYVAPAPLDTADCVLCDRNPRDTNLSSFWPVLEEAGGKKDAASQKVWIT